MGEWWDSLSLLGRIFCIAAVPATVVMILQAILLFFGIGSGDGADAGGSFDGDAGVGLDGAADGGFGGDTGGFDGGSEGDFDGSLDGSGLALFTVRGIVAFFAVGGWTGVVLVKNDAGEIISVVVAVLAGLAALVGIALLYKYALKLQDNGTLQIKNAVGKNGTVYLTIPGGRAGAGKVMVTVQERLCELNAVTDEAGDIKTNEAISVTGVVDGQTVMVARQDGILNKTYEEV